MNRLGPSAIIFSLLFLIITGCTYRFTNLYLRPPVGVRSIAIESVYDTSRSVVPHEFLWESLQKEFAADGRLVVVLPEEADIYLRAQLSSAVVLPGDIKGELAKDPEVNLDAQEGFLAPSAFSNLKAADRYATAESLVITVNIEVWHLGEKKLLLQKTYAASGSHKIYNAATPLESHFIKAEEGFNVLFADLSEDIARSVVRDFLSLTL